MTEQPASSVSRSPIRQAAGRAAGLVMKRGIAEETDGMVYA